MLQGTGSEQGWSQEPVSLPSFPQCCRVQDQSRVDLKNQYHSPRSHNAAGYSIRAGLISRTNITPLVPTVLQGTGSEQGWSQEPISLPSFPQCCRVQHQSRVDLKNKYHFCYPHNDSGYGFETGVNVKLISSWTTVIIISQFQTYKSSKVTHLL